MFEIKGWLSVNREARDHGRIEGICWRALLWRNKLEANDYIEGPEILESDAEGVLKKIRLDKAIWQDEISTELLISLGEFRIKKLTTIMSIIYNTGKIYKITTTKSVFTAIP